MVLRVSRFLEFLGPFVEVPVRVVGVTPPPAGQGPGSGPNGGSGHSTGPGGGSGGSGPPPSGPPGGGGGGGGGGPPPPGPPGEAEAGTPSRLTHHREVVRVADIVDLVVVPLEVRRSLRDRQGHLMTLRTSLMESVSESLRINVVRSVFRVDV